jgi:ABC-2 type transport system ATP-binding protein
MAAIEARGLYKAFGKTVVLDGVDFKIEEGRIVGLIGPNGAGKTTALKAILGLTPFRGELKVLGRNPHLDRHQLMQEVCFIADVAVLPRWMRVSQALDYVAGVHPRFDRAKSEAFLARTTIKRTSRVRELSKGMLTQLHLALVMAIDARLLVLDEPTLGLDLLYRKQFYDSLLNDYFDHSRTIVITTARARLQHGRFRNTLCRSHGASGQGRGGAGAGPDSRTTSLRPQRIPVRSCRSRETCSARRNAHAEHRRPVRRHYRW